MIRKNKNRGYQNLCVWNDAIEFYRQVYAIFHNFPYYHRKISEHTIATSDSVHRNIAEGYCRRSIREYLQFLYIALGSLGECVSSFNAYKKTNQVSNEQFELLDALAFKLENKLLKLVQALEKKKANNEWIDTLQVKENTALYECEEII